MKLFYSQTSPFVRIVRLVASHHSLDDRIDLVGSGLFEDEAALRAANPLGKIPALLTDDAAPIFDSSVIAKYLDDMGTNTTLFENPAHTTWELQTWYALANGVLEAAVSQVLLGRRPTEEQSAFWMARWADGVDQGINIIAENVPQLSSQTTIAHLAFPAALDFVSFRLPECAWRTTHPALAKWSDAQLSLGAFKATDPRL